MSLIPDLSHFGIAGYWLVLLFSFAEAFVFTGWVVPGTILVVIAGGLSAHGVYDFWDLVFFATIGAIIGDGISYEIGRRGKAFIQRKPFLQKQTEKGKPFFLKHQGKSIFFGRFIGWIRPIVPFIAGVMYMSRIRFYIINICSAIAWAIAYLGLGYIFGAAWKVALLWASRAGVFILIGAMLIMLLVWLWRWTVRHGRHALVVLLSIGTSVLLALKGNPYIAQWIQKYPYIFSFIRRCFSIQQFSGLPLTFFVLACASSMYVLIGITEDYLTGDPLALADVRLANLLVAFRSQTLLNFFYIITLSAQAVVIVPVAIISSIVLWIFKKKASIFTLWIALIGSQGITILGKILFHRARPNGIIPAIVEDSFSYPSGHATAVAAFYGFLAYLYIRNHPLWKVKISAFFLVVLMIILVDMSRLYLGIHFLSDVLAGNMVGLMMLLFAISITEWFMWNKKKDTTYISFAPLGVICTSIMITIATMTAVLPSPWKNTRASAQTTPIHNGDILSLFEQHKLPRFTETLLGNPQEPINFLIIGNTPCVEKAFTNADWIEAEHVSFVSTYRAAKAAVLNAPYPTAPITPSFYNGFPHDIGFEKSTAQDSVRSRHHARLWKTDFTDASQSIFVGTASLDKGIKWGITHAIDPAIDTERDLLVSDLENTGMIQSRKDIPFVPSELGSNFSGDQFFTDGDLVILHIDTCSGGNAS